MITRLYLMPTHNCNCDCVYCYIPDDERHKTSDNLYLHSVVDNFMQHLDKHNSDESPEIRFIGGEPYLDENFIIKVSNLFLTRFNTGKIIVNTNGTLITKEVIEQINLKHRERFVNIISLDGIEDVHNARRISKNRTNSFNQAVSGIKILKSYKMPVYINMVLDDFTVSKLDEFMYYIKSEFDMHELSVSLLYNPAKPLSGELKYKLIEKAYALAKNHEILLGGHHRLLLGFENPEFMCKAGKKTVLISSDEKAYACQRFVGRVEAAYFNQSSDFETVSFSSCIENECYSKENKQLGKKIFQLYSNGSSSYRSINWFDKILFGVI